MFKDALSEFPKYFGWFVPATIVTRSVTAVVKCGNARYDCVLVSLSPHHLLPYSRVLIVCGVPGWSLSHLTDSSRNREEYSHEIICWHWMLRDHGQRCSHIKYQGRELHLSNTVISWLWIGCNL